MLQKTIAGVALAFVAVVSVAQTTEAAMPHFIGDGYKQFEQCVPFHDHYVYEIVNGASVPTGCIDADAYEASQKSVYYRALNGYTFAAGSFVTLISGKTETCPAWYHMGCVIDTALITF